MERDCELDLGFRRCEPFLFWAHGVWGGPPYSTDRQDLETVFSPYFEITALAMTPYSAERSKDEELLGILTKRSLP